MIFSHDLLDREKHMFTASLLHWPFTRVLINLRARYGPVSVVIPKTRSLCVTSLYRLTGVRGSRRPVIRVGCAYTDDPPIRGPRQSQNFLQAPLTANDRRRSRTSTRTRTRAIAHTDVFASSAGNRSSADVSRQVHRCGAPAHKCSRIVQRIDVTLINPETPTVNRLFRGLRVVRWNPSAKHTGTVSSLLRGVRENACWRSRGASVAENMSAR